MVLNRFDEVGQLLHEVGHLLYKVGQLLYEVHLLTTIRGCGRQAQVQLESIKTLCSFVSTISFNIIV